MSHVAEGCRHAQRAYPFIQGSRISLGTDELAGALLLLCTGVTIFVLWLNPDRAWLHPELAAIGNHVVSAPRGRIRTIRLILDWSNFSGDTDRARLVTGFFEVIDALARPHIAHAIAHPALVLRQSFMRY